MNLVNLSDEMSEAKLYEIQRKLPNHVVTA
jgi:hypothetical protein